MNKTKEIPIFFSCDDNYIPYLAVSLESLEANANKEYRYLIKVLHTNTISPSNQAVINKKYHKDCFDIEFVDISQYVDDIASKLHTRDYYSKCTYYRLFIPNLYPQYDKALYLDSDITIVGDISELYNTDLGTNLVGAIPDESVQNIEPFQIYVEKRIHCNSYTEYFNAGILVMNLKELRTFDFETKFINMISQVTFNVAQDQDYLNAICRNRVKLISTVWNKMPMPNPNVKEEDIRLMHFNLDMKPWQRDGVMYETKFWEYARLTDFYEDIVEYKKNYPPAWLKDRERETIELIALTQKQSEETEENKRILNVINKICNN